MKLNEKIYTCRKRKGLSQEDLALRIGVSRQSVSKWETGEASPEISKLPLLAKEFDVSTDWLLSEDEFIETIEPIVEEKTYSNNPTYPSWVEKLPRSILSMIKRFGWIYGLVLAGQGLLFTAVGLLARGMFKSMILGNHNDIIIEGDIPLSALDQFIMNPNFGYYSDVQLQGWKMASMFTGFIIGLGIVIIIIGLVLAISLKIWGNKKTNEEF